MPDYDVGAVGLPSPPASAVVQSYRPAVSVRNYGVHDALAVGSLRIYSAGLLIFTTEVYSGVIAPGETKPAQAVDYWTPPALGRYQFIAYVSCINDQFEPNNNLAPCFIDVIPGEPTPPTPVAMHAAQHEEGGGDELNIDGLHGRATDAQTPIAHKTSHQAGGADTLDVTGLLGTLGTPQPIADHHESHENHGGDELNVNGLAGKLADQQTPEAHHARHEVGGDDEITALGAHATRHENGGPDEISIAGLSGNPAARGQTDGLAELDETTKVPAEQLGGTVGPLPGFLRSDRTWQPVAAESHHATHETGGDDELSVADLHGVLADAQPTAAHKTTHETGGGDELSVTDLHGVLADAQVGQAHASTHEAGGLDVVNVNGLSGTLADPQDPVGHAANHGSEGLDPVNIASLQGVPACVGAASGAASLDTTTKVPTAQLGGEGATASTFLRGDQTWATPPAQAAHKATHENGGADEISIAGLSGVAADAQNPVNHGASHGHEGGDDISIGGLSGMPAAAGVNGGLAELDIDGLVPADQLGTGETGYNVYLRGDRTWSGVIPSPHAATHLPSGGDIFTHGAANHNNSEPVAVSPGGENAEGIAVQTVRADHVHRACGGVTADSGHIQEGEQVISQVTVPAGLNLPGKLGYRISAGGSLHTSFIPGNLSLIIRLGPDPVWSNNPAILTFPVLAPADVPGNETPFELSALIGRVNVVGAFGRLSVFPFPQWLMPSVVVAQESTPPDPGDLVLSLSAYSPFINFDWHTFLAIIECVKL